MHYFVCNLQKPFWVPATDTASVCCFQYIRGFTTMRYINRLFTYLFPEEIYLSTEKTKSALLVGRVSVSVCVGLASEADCWSPHTDRHGDFNSLLQMLGSLSIHPSVCLCLSVRLSVCLFACLSESVFMFCCCVTVNTWLLTWWLLMELDGLSA